MQRPQVVWGEVTIDCLDTERVATFWASLLDLQTQAQPDRWFRLGPPVPGGPVINFQPVTEEKTCKARAHLDLWVDDLDVAISLVQRLGGRGLDEVHVHAEGTVVVMADPEGNEFCLVAMNAKPACVAPVIAALAEGEASEGPPHHVRPQTPREADHGLPFSVYPNPSP